MKQRNGAFFLILQFLFTTVGIAQTNATEEVLQPSVARRVTNCDQWQWIGNNATTWGCVSVPREASVAHGITSDKAISSLQEQINKLEAKIKMMNQNCSSSIAAPIAPASERYFIVK